MIIQEFLCFGVNPGGGNAALVVQHDHSSTEQRQRFALEHNRPACVFVDVAADGGVVLDYFYTHARSPLCLHATLAAARVLLTSPAASPLAVRTAMRGQELTLTLAGENVFIALTPQQQQQLTITPALVARLLAMPGTGIALASAPAIASVGSPKLLLEVADSATLQALRPDLKAIAAWGNEHGVNGCYVWCRRDDGVLEGRNFNHLDPEKEDSATGVAAGALSLHLATSLTLYQGTNRGQPCRILALRNAGPVDRQGGGHQPHGSNGVSILIGGTAEPI